MVADGVSSLDDQEIYLQHLLEKSQSTKVEKKDAKQNFFVMMDARITKEKPFTDPNFDHEALVKFMGVKFAFGIIPTDYLSSMGQMFKKKEKPTTA